MNSNLPSRDVTWVTGGAGAIGSAVVELILSQGLSVGTIGNGLDRFAIIKNSANFSFVDGLIEYKSLDALANITGVPAAVIHLAGGAQVNQSFLNPDLDFNRTVGSTSVLLSWLRNNASSAVLVYASSAAIYGRACSGPITEDLVPAPISPYGFHKLMVEEYLRFWGRQFGLKSVIVRLFSVYGPQLRKQLIYELNQRLCQYPSVLQLNGTGEELRDWLWIDDAAKILVSAKHHATTDVALFNAGTGIGTTLRRMCELVINQFDQKTKLEFSGNAPQGDPFSLVADMSRANESGLVSKILPEIGIPMTINGYRTMNLSGAQ